MGYMCIKNSSLECDGCMACREEKRYRCPVCGEEILEKVFVDYMGNVIGCENCAEEKDPWEFFE
jgi:predicted amidophosphoribosyltransferase